MRVISSFGIFCCCVVATHGASVTDGITAFEQGKYSIALNLLQPAAQSGDERAKLYLALTQAALNRCDAALPVLTANLNSRLAGLAVTRCYSSSGDLAKALSSAEDLKTRFPDDPDVLYVAAETEMKAFNNTTLAMFQRTP